MTAHRVPANWHQMAERKVHSLTDPGDAGDIDPRNGGELGICLCDIVTAAAETRTVSDPAGPLQLLLLRLKTDGGDCTITFDSAYNKDGDTVLVLDDAQDAALFYGVEDGSGTFAWRMLDNSGSRLVSVGDANYTVLETNSGKPHLVANVSADRTFTLPSPKAGLDFEFIANAVVADGHDWIFDTGSDTNYFTGGVQHLDTDAGSAGDEVVPIRPDGNSNSKLQINLPDVGTKVRFISDGTLWNVSGEVYSTTAPTFADQ